MCAALVGGLTRLKREYMETAKTQGVRLKVFTGEESKIAARIGEADLVIVFTNKVSHEARNQVAKFAKDRGIPLCLVHACGAKDLSGCLRP